MIVALIPVRGGSKSIPMKNIKAFAGKPLVYWTIKAADQCECIDRVYVATDSELIRSVVLGFGFKKVEVIERGSETATDIAKTESIMLEFANRHDFDKIVLIQATSPLLTSEDLKRGLNELEVADSVLSVARQKRFLWKQEKYATPINYDYSNRPRRQELEGYLVENGAFYMTRRTALLRTGCRLSGNIRTVEMPEDSYYEIDELSDWFITEMLLKRRLARNTHSKIKMFLTDCDGTLTDGGMYYTSEGDAMKKFSTHDGVGLRLLRESGIITGIITGEDSEIVRKRGKKLSVDEILLGISDKMSATIDLCEKYCIQLSETAYIGDDLNDIETLMGVGLSFCPANAVDEVKSIVDYVTKNAGGQGAVRESAEYIIGELSDE